MLLDSRILAPSGCHCEFHKTSWRGICPLKLRKLTHIFHFIRPVNLELHIANLKSNTKTQKTGAYHMMPLLNRQLQILRVVRTCALSAYWPAWYCAQFKSHLILPYFVQKSPHKKEANHMYFDKCACHSSTLCKSLWNNKCQKFFKDTFLRFVILLQSASSKVAYPLDTQESSCPTPPWRRFPPPPIEIPAQKSKILREVIIIMILQLANQNVWGLASFSDSNASACCPVEYLFRTSSLSIQKNESGVFFRHLLCSSMQR